jgi:hypothetical protein
MHALPPITNPLRPPARRSWFPPLKFSWKAYQKLCRSFDLSLAELEAKYPSHRSAIIEERRQMQLTRRPR